ncbi:hypothetical protein pdul_cds_819 [Pandoravirus dulcis]|uniref:Uncharacterized protein n=1 Tax=Pandoravirus dulcis TaxID=1349409 RepID=S4VYA1_9VIRU|nr:hypothetical protein pdul_cds_819 [Pandoravirus dulcis]AGO83026.1 hypothetical protein pdul_cds_819 [Pandoravirus dulcis]
MERPEDESVEVAGAFLRTLAGARSDRQRAEADRAAAIEAAEIVQCFPSLDARVDDWPERLHAIAAKHATTLPSDDERAQTDQTRRHTARQHRLNQVVEIAACIDAISAIEPVVHALSESPEGAPVARLHCSDGARRLVFAIDIAFKAQSPSDILGACVPWLVFLDTQRLLRLRERLCTPTTVWKRRDGWRPCMSTDAAVARLMADLVKGHVADWTAFAGARYAQLAALPDALARRGWTVVVNDRTAGWGRAWTDAESLVELAMTSVEIARPDGLRLFVVWTDGRLSVASQDRFRYVDKELPVFFDRPSLVTPVHVDDDGEDDPMKGDESRVADDWWVDDEANDMADLEISLDRERAWMVGRGYISSRVIGARPQGYYGRGQRPPLALGHAGDTADEMALRVDAYADYVRGAYGPIDDATGAHLNGPWCKQRLVDALGDGDTRRLSHIKGPIDPAGPVVTNSFFEYPLNDVLGASCSVNLWGLPDIVAHAHLVGESNGAASAYFSVVVRHHVHHREDRDDRRASDDHRGSEEPAARPSPPRSYGSLVQSLAAIAKETHETQDTADPDHESGVHPLVRRNARASRLSARTAAVIYDRHLSGEGIDLVRAHAWMTDRFMSVIRVFQEASSAFGIA